MGTVSGLARKLCRTNGRGEAGKKQLNKIVLAAVCHPAPCWSSPDCMQGAGDGHPACNAFSFATMGAHVAADTPGSCATYSVE